MLSETTVNVTSIAVSVLCMFGVIELVNAVDFCSFECRVLLSSKSSKSCSTFDTLLFTTIMIPT